MLSFRERPTWLRLVFSLRGSALVRIRYRLLAVLLVSLVLTYLHELGPLRSRLTLPALSLMGLALGIFLGFRNNTSYDRFWEGRKLWGALVNTSRGWARDVLTLPDCPEGAAEAAAWQRAQIYREIAFVHALRLTLRGAPDSSELEALLSTEELAQARSKLNLPDGILLLMARANRSAFEHGWLSDFRFVRLAERLSQLSDIQGGCERIRSTPIPHSYSILIHRIVAIYVFALPFGLVDSLHFATPFVVLMVAYTFLGHDAVGDEHEDPFGEDLNDLPLSTLARMIEINLRQSLGETDVPRPLEPVDGHLL